MFKKKKEQKEAIINWLLIMQKAIEQLQNEVIKLKTKNLLNDSQITEFGYDNCKSKFSVN